VWGVVLRQPNGGLYRTHHLAWMGGCAHIEQIGSCMGQWNSKRDAEARMEWEEIIRKYYDGVEIIHP